MTYDTWRPSGKRGTKRKNTGVDDPGTAKKLKSVHLPIIDESVGPIINADRLRRPVGMKWDSQDHSCGYDATFTILANIWVESDHNWRVIFPNISPMMTVLSEQLLKASAGIQSLEEARNKVRGWMHRRQPEDFPYGPHTTSVDRIAQLLLPSDPHATGRQMCPACGYSDPTAHELLYSYCSAGLSSDRNYPDGVLLSVWLQRNLTKGRRRCPSCTRYGQNQRLTMLPTILRVPPVLLIYLDHKQLKFDPVLQFDVQGSMGVIRCERRYTENQDDEIQLAERRHRRTAEDMVSDSAFSKLSRSYWGYSDPTLPNEIIGIIVDHLAYDDDNSSTSIAMAVCNIFNFRSVCRAIQSFCIEYGPAWANIPLQASEFGPPVEDGQTWADAPQYFAGWGLPSRVPRLGELRATLARSRGSPLRISFNLELSLSAQSPREGDELLAEIVLHHERWAVINVEGPTACHGTTACAKASASIADFSRTRPKLRSISLTTNDYFSRFVCVASHKRQTLVDVGNLQRLTANIPIALLHPLDEDTPTCLASNMVYLDIGNQSNATIVPLLTQTPNLTTLHWGKNRSDINTPVALIPSLRHLFLDSSSEPPPLVAPELISFTSTNIGFVLDDATFESITGSSIALKTLDIIGSKGIGNADLMAIWNRCPSLTHLAFASGSGSEERTEMFRALGNQVASQYISRRTSELETLSCHGMRHSKSRDIYDFLRRLGTQENGTHLRFHPSVFMVRSGPCTDKFNIRNSKIFQSFKEENDLDSDLLILAMYEAYFSTFVPHSFTLAIIFSSEKAARKCVEKGVKFNSHRCEWARLM
ncbi:hypothetical protein DFH06DRAFT_1137827 [Mycena polygramma]|nr:hypothetical protein DFH06DRAFT_1137827 [Mycena polygramma]